LIKKSKYHNYNKNEKENDYLEGKNFNLWQTVMKRSVKIFNFYDLGGSEKAQKNSVKKILKNYFIT